MLKLLSSHAFSSPKIEEFLLPSNVAIEIKLWTKRSVKDEISRILKRGNSAKEGNGTTFVVNYLEPDSKSLENLAGINDCLEKFEQLSILYPIVYIGGEKSIIIVVWASGDIVTINLSSSYGILDIHFETFLSKHLKGNRITNFLICDKTGVFNSTDPVISGFTISKRDKSFKLHWLEPVCEECSCRQSIPQMAKNVDGNLIAFWYKNSDELHPWSPFKNDEFEKNEIRIYHLIDVAFKLVSACRRQVGKNLLRVAFAHSLNQKNGQSPNLCKYEADYQYCTNNGEMLYIAEENDRNDNDVRIWITLYHIDVEKGTLGKVKIMEFSLNSQAISFEFNDMCNKAAVATGDKMIYLLDIKNACKANFMRVSFIPRFIKFHPECDSLAIADDNGKVQFIHEELYVRKCVILGTSCSPHDTIELSSFLPSVEILHKIEWLSCKNAKQSSLIVLSFSRGFVVSFIVTEEKRKTPGITGMLRHCLQRGIDRNVEYLIKSFFTRDWTVNLPFYKRLLMSIYEEMIFQPFEISQKWIKLMLWWYYESTAPWSPDVRDVFDEIFGIMALRFFNELNRVGILAEHLRFILQFKNRSFLKLLADVDENFRVEMIREKERVNSLQFGENLEGFEAPSRNVSKNEKCSYNTRKDVLVEANQFFISNHAQPPLAKNRTSKSIESNINVITSQHNVNVQKLQIVNLGEV